jgi:hypothetical protein
MGSCEGDREGSVAASRVNDMRLDAVDVRLTFDGAQVGRSLEAFRLGCGARQRSVYFCEDVMSSVSRSTPLLDLGVILRARETYGNRCDSTSSYGLVADPNCLTAA